MLPVVKTAHLTLRPLQAADIEPLYNIQSDAQAMAYTYIAKSLEEFTEHIQAYANLETTLGYAPWAIVATEFDLLCGWGGLCIDPFDPGWGVEVSYYFSPTVWGRGYATELTRASLKYGFMQFGLPLIGAFAHRENLASNRVLEKCGFRFTGYEAKLDRNRYEFRQEWWSE